MYRMEEAMTGSSSSLGRRCSGNIPEEIVEQILARLPVKSLLRFESVCKTWYSLIRSRPFINLHHHYHPHQQHHNLFFCNSNPASKSYYAISSITPCPSPPPPFHLRRFNDVPKTLFEFRLPKTLTLGRCPWDGGSLMEFPCFRMIGPSEHDGIYCFISDLFPVLIRVFSSAPTCTYNNLIASLKKERNKSSANIALANLATRRIHVIPPFPFDKVARQCAYINTSWHTKTEFGFGCVQNDDYKVVVIVQVGWKFKSIAFVYSSKRASWNQICYFKSNKSPALAGLQVSGSVRFPEILHYDDPLHKRMVRHSNCSFLDGSCHWVASVMHGQQYYCILVFDMRTEVFSLMRGPPSHGYDEHRGYLRREIFVVRGHIGVALIHGSGVDMWMMMAYGDEGSWVACGSCSCRFGSLVPSVVGLSLGADNSDDRLYLEGHDATLFDASFHLNDEIYLDQRPCLYSFALGFQPPNFETLGVSF